MAPYLTMDDINWLEYLKDGWAEYPTGLRGDSELGKLVDDIRHNFVSNKEDSIDSILISEGSSSAVFIHDYRNDAALDREDAESTDNDEDHDDRDVNPSAPQAPTPTSSEHRSSTASSLATSTQQAVKDSGSLKDTIQWPVVPSGMSAKQYVLERVLRDEDNPTGLLKDPACRLVFIETAVPARRKLIVTEEILLKILTYHQVSPCYLDFLSCIVADLLVTESDRFFGGFRNLKFPHSSNEIASLGRSRYRFQLTFALKAVFRPRPLPLEDQVDLKPSQVTRHFQQRRTSESDSLRNTNRLSLSEDPEPVIPVELRPMLKTQTWPIFQAAICHHFDVKNGRSFWIIAAPGQEALKASAKGVAAFQSVRNYHEKLSIQTETKSLRFESSLEMMLWLSQWSLSHFVSLVDYLDKEIKQKTLNVIDDKRLDFKNAASKSSFEQQRLTALNFVLEQVNECINSLKGNLRVIKALRKFYQFQLLTDVGTDRDISWLQDEREKLNAFSQQLKVIYIIIENLVRRAELLSQTGQRREDLLHRMLHVRNEATTIELNDSTRTSTLMMRDNSKRMQDDSQKMKGYAAVTFLLLPMTVVSTFFATDVVKFQDIETRSLVGKWSGGAGIWFVGAMAVLMIFVYLTFKWGEWVWDFLLSGVMFLLKTLIKPFRGGDEGGDGGGDGGDDDKDDEEGTTSENDPDSEYSLDKPAPVTGTEKGESPVPTSTNCPQQIQVTSGSHDNSLNAQRTRSATSVDANLDSPGGTVGSASPLLTRRSNGRETPDLEKGDSSPAHHL